MMEEHALMISNMSPSDLEASALRVPSKGSFQSKSILRVVTIYLGYREYQIPQ